MSSLYIVCAFTNIILCYRGVDLYRVIRLVDDSTWVVFLEMTTLLSLDDPIHE